MTRIEVIRLTPPEALLQGCLKPGGPLRTNLDLLRELLRADAALEECDARLKALRDWAAAVAGESGK